MVMKVDDWHWKGSQICQSRDDLNSSPSSLTADQLGLHVRMRGPLKSILTPSILLSLSHPHLPTTVTRTNVNSSSLLYPSHSPRRGGSLIRGEG
ncbi:hypothetical protein PILCRDRAFT_693701 [Piloderma croceum F 1598]|uniref:Uncharacterized protein n=1 Tax=Piloderma croceum (strain F 1598) TaxID=765440 RepID=A0A0C3F423_PILCF|nr:hypothetical protein PILCRDRAFT_693701 [Piloderma croceum F 1598]